jgi:glycosyltransferase involved in cell wall biosynthesis
MINDPINDRPKLSVVTIVFNNVLDIERTLRSVIGQSYSNIEYIVVDGASNDGTLEILERYRSDLAKLISEKDKGIYDAMNKGLAQSTGDYVIFMNSGDEFFDLQTVEKVFSKQPEWADIYYGETVLINEKGETLGLRKHRAPEKFNWKSFRYGMNVGHQAIYIKKEITTPYREEYALSADVDWIIRAAKKARTCVNVDMVVARFLVGGLSKKRKRQSLVERYQIFSKHYGWFQNLFNHGIIMIRWLIGRLLNKTKY